MSSPSRSEGRPVAGSPEIDASVRDAIEDFARHSRKNSEAIDVLVHALKAVHQDLQEEKVRPRSSRRASRTRRPISLAWPASWTRCGGRDGFSSRAGRSSGRRPYQSSPSES